MTEPEVDRLGEEPPLLGSWNRLYALVIGNLVLWIAAGWVVARWYAP